MGRTSQQLAQGLLDLASGRLSSSVLRGSAPSSGRPRLAFALSGQGAQYAGMGRALYQRFASFRSAFDELAALHRDSTGGQSLTSLVFDSPDAALRDTGLAQPSLFAFQYALSRLWLSLGVSPSALIGHSIGEYLAAHLAGVLSLHDAYLLVLARSRAMASLPPGGSMLSVLASPSRLAPFLSSFPSLELAADNGPEACVLSGPLPDIERLLPLLESADLSFRPLHVSHAFHSAAMLPAMAALSSAASRLPHHSPSLPLASNLTGALATPSLFVPDYWARHLRQPVLFRQGLEALVAKKFTHFLEIGPRPVLTGLLRSASKGLSCIPSLDSSDPERAFCSAAASLHALGLDLDWKGLFPGKTPRWASLPTYPFERTRFWASKTFVESKKDTMQVNAQTRQATPDSTTAVAATARAVRALFAEQLSTEADRLDQDTPLLELGADSFVMVSALKKLAEIWQVRMSVRDLFEVHLTVNQIAAHLVATSPVADGVAARHSGPAIPAAEPVRAPAPPAPRMGTPAPAAPQQAVVPEAPKPARTFAPAPAPTRAPAPTATGAYQPPRFGNTKPAAAPGMTPRPPASRLTTEQAEYLARFTARYTSKTGRSKELAAATRGKLVNTRRSSSGFRLETKELTYPIVATDSKGSRIRDLDGNEYVDLAMGFGATLFGHNPDFVREALAVRLEKGYQIGPASELAGECARLISTVTGMDRVLFLNSGTEAVMTAMRIARAATGRSKVVVFQNAYHGHFDATMVTPDIDGGGATARPMTLGTPQRMIDDVIVLPYANPRSIDTIRALGHELAAVIVEPVQNRRPDLHPTEFLQALREVTRETGSLLVFDEILVGFRIALGGSQEWFGVQADMVTYGKIIGGGLPLGVIAGRHEIMDRVDGGAWNYGDDSAPQENTTYTAGTFSMHPLAMAACHATLTEMLRQGGELQRALNQRADRLMEILNEVFTNNQVPLMAVNFGSFFRFAQSGNLSFVYQPIELDLFFYHLIEKGVYVWEGRTCFISTAHDDKDMDVIIQAVHESVSELKAGGFWPGREGPGGGSGRPDSGSAGHASSGAKTTASPVAPAVPSPRDAGRASLLGRAMRQDEGSPAARAPEPSRTKPPPRAMPAPIVDDSYTARRSDGSTIDFSLYYFGDLAEDAQSDKYRLLLDGAQFADENGFQAVWLPERHFHSFGGFSPNPSVVTAALSQRTKRVDLRASVLIPLQHPIRVAEEWAVLDNLSQGRVGIALASGWHANDFVLDPESWERKREVMVERLGALQHLWRASAVPFSGPNGQDVPVRIFPRPTRASLPLWLTTLGNRETWSMAGRLGLGVLTNLIGQKISDIADNIQAYRQARTEVGLDPNRGHVTVLLHTLVGAELNEVREQARAPFGRYLASSLGLFQQMVREQGLTADFDTLTPEDRAFLLNAAYNRYASGNALIGTVESTAAVVDQLVAAGVDELACFIDFGVEHDYVRSHLRFLGELKDRYRKPTKKALPSSLTYTSTAPIVMPSARSSAGRPSSAPASETAVPASSADEDEGKRIALRLPLTGDQRMLWFLARMGADGLMAYAQTIVLRLTGPFDVAAMQRAYAAVIARHEALRIVFADDGESQSVLARGVSEVPIINLSALDSEPRARQLEACLADEAERPFELDESLVRLAVVKLTETEHVLVLTSHHLVCDGVSVGILLTELAALYADASKAAKLPPAPSFAEHVHWRLAQHQEADYAREEAYWLQVIGTKLPVLELPTDRRRPPIKTYDGDRVTLTLEAAFFTRLKGFAQEIRSTYFMVVLGAFAAFLHRVARQDQVVVGVPFGGRGREGSQTMIGYLSNVYPIVSRLELGDSVATYLDRLRATLLDAYDHQSYPFSALVAKAMSSTGSGRAPFFSVAFNWDRVDLPRLEGLAVEQLEFRPRYVDYDLMPNIMEVNGEVVISWDYNSQLFDRGTLETLANQFVVMLRALVRDANAQVHDLPLRDAAAEVAFLQAHATPRRAPEGLRDTLSALLADTVAPHGATVSGEVYVVDVRGRPAPEGHVGEILVGVTGVAVGEQVMPNPFGPGVVYRTGALGRYRSGGVLDLLEHGREDAGRAAPAQETERASSTGLGQTTAQGEVSTLTDIWLELLGVPTVSADQDFFTLGGHSLSAVRMVARIRECFGVDLSLGVLFDAPTIRQLARVIADKQSKSESASAPDEVGAVAIRPDPTHRHEPFDLTELQQAYWLGQSDSLSGGGLPGVAYLEHEILDLDVDRFERAFQKVIERHPMLRAVIRKDGLQQVLSQTPPFRIDCVDLRALGEEERSATLRRTEIEVASRGLSPDTWPTLALRVHRLDARRYRIHLGFPLLLGDLQSGRIFIRDLDQMYRDVNADLPPVGFDYRDYVNTLSETRATAAFKRAETYWRDRLATLPLAPSLPRANSAQDKEARDEGTAFMRHEGLLPRAAWDALKRRARAAGLTPAALVTAVYAEAITEFCESPHFTLNLLYQNRPSWHPRIQEVVGNFSTTILLEVDNREPLPFEKRVRALQTRLWSDMEHAQVSGIQVVRELARQRGSSVASSMPVVLASSLHMSAAEVESDALFFTVVSNRLQTPHVWIDHQVMESRAGLRFHWDVRKGIFPPGLTASMFAIFTDLLAKLAKGRGWDEVRPVELRPSEFDARTRANASDKPQAREMLHELFATQAVQRPQHPAIIAGERVISYGELSERANRLAHRIRAHGVGPNQLVAISMDKGWEQLVAVLGVLHAGAAYLPVDPSLPTERLHTLMQHGRAALILTQQALESTVAWPEDLPRLVVARESETGDATPLPFTQTASDLAYVIFTSGSTGVPKGVMIDHRGAVNTVLDINRRFNVGPEDRVLAVSSLSFDLSVYDVFGLLAAGGSVVIPDAAQAREPAHWARLIHEHRVTIWNSVPQLMQLLVDREEQEHAAPLESLRVVMLSGDWIPVSLPGRIQARTERCQVASLGGATEASIWSIIHPIDRVDPSWQSIPYGRPLDNQRFHVLDAALRPRPTWVQGELYIAGIGLAQGYLSDPDKTRDRFIHHPVTGERMYRTGDLGRYLSDGNIEFLGRADHQVKVQGYRVELGEIEASLEKHPRVKACVVSAYGPSRGERRLVAYVVGQDTEPGDTPAAVDTEALRKHLATQLPAYMVPGQFVLLSELPLTSNGKIDRQALPTPDAVLGVARRAKRVAPQTPLQHTLAEIWREVLAVDDIGIHDDFFAELGGHSFAAVRLLARVNAKLGRELPLSSLLEGPTLAHQAERLHQAALEGADPAHVSGAAAVSNAPAWSPVVPLRKQGSERPLFLVHPVGGNVFCYRALVASISPKRPVYGLQARGFVGEQTPLDSLQEMASIYVDAMRGIQPRGPYLLGGWSMGGLVALEMARVFEEQGDEVELLALIDSVVPGRKTMLDGLGLLAWFMRDLLATSSRVCDLDLSGLEHLDDAARLTAVLERAKAKNAIAQDVTAEQLERLYRVFVRHSAAMDAYAPTPVRAPVLLLDAADSEERERVAPWKRLTSSLKHHRIAGNHYSILGEPHVATLAKRLGAALRDK
ncbi:non-ribosomal peptide synthetase [Corallococcus sp. AB011P]|uniref:non-ribosomal peptide synthetase n=1 Tax=Corallococcus sp. AB011P TaxID=2316735 RepID=UPI0011C387D0|nr:non-ribosomal peptide synthetase [Corallococcus sp. AB011P]